MLKSPEPVWYAARTNPRCEDRAVASIASKGFATYLPQARKHIVHHRTRVLLPKAFPLLVGYVLVDLPSAGHAGHLRGCDGVKGILGVGGTPLPLPGREVQAIMEAETTMNEAFERQKRAMERKDHGLVAGEKVRFSRGAWSGFEATVMDAKSKRAIKVLMEVFGRMTEVEAPVDFLQRAA